MSKFKTYLVADEDNRRGYKARQLYANSKGADVYLEFHFNASAYDKPGTADNPAMMLVADNASQKTRSIATDLSARVAEKFKFPNRGVVTLRRNKQTGKADRAYWNLYYTNMRAVLLEPFYVSDIEQAQLALDPSAQKKLAKVIFEVLREHYPQGATFALSLGHKFKPAPSHFDRGAPIKVGMDDDPDDPKPIYHPTMAEADCAEKVMHYFIDLCEGRPVETAPPTNPDEFNEPLPPPPKDDLVLAVQRLSESMDSLGAEVRELREQVGKS